MIFPTERQSEEVRIARIHGDCTCGCHARNWPPAFQGSWTCRDCGVYHGQNFDQLLLEDAHREHIKDQCALCQETLDRYRAMLTSRSPNQRCPMCTFGEPPHRNCILR